MNIRSLIFSYILTFIVFLIVDMAWLGFIAKNLYHRYLGEVLSDTVNWTAAFVFYLIYVVGVSVFAIYPAINKDSAFNAILLGALFGAFAYATYDLTNLATMKNWPLTIVIIDIFWGAFLTAVVSFVGFHIVKLVH